MHVVYKLTFNNRLKEQTPPYFYIGSKSNCTVIDNVIYSKKNKQYWGSSRDNIYLESLRVEKPFVEILGTFENYEECLLYERTVQISVLCVENFEYFNKSYAMQNNYSDPGYGTYKHISGSKTVRLKTDNPLVLSGEYVGVTKNKVYSEERRKKHSKPGNQNAFYGKKHTKETKEKISMANSGRILSEERKKQIGDSFRGKEKTEEQKKKMSISGQQYTMFWNKNTGEVKRLKKTDTNILDEEWTSTNPKILLRDTCIYCGIESIKGNIIRWHNENCKYKETPKQIYIPKRKRIPVIIDGIQYKSINSASRQLNIKKQEVIRLHLLNKDL